MLMTAVKDWRLYSASSGVIVPYVVKWCVHMVRGRTLSNPLVVSICARKELAGIFVVIADFYGMIVNAFGLFLNSVATYHWTWVGRDVLRDGHDDAQMAIGCVVKGGEGLRIGV